MRTYMSKGVLYRIIRAHAERMHKLCEFISLTYSKLYTCVVRPDPLSDIGS